MPSPGESSRPRDRTCISMSPELASKCFTTGATWETPIVTIEFIKLDILFSLNHLSEAFLMLLPERYQIVLSVYRNFLLLFVGHLNYIYVLLYDKSHGDEHLHA